MYVNPIVRCGNLRECGPTKSKLSCVVHSGRDSRRDACNLGKIPRDQGQTADRDFVDYPAQSGTFGLDCCRLRIHLDAVKHGCQSETQFEVYHFGDAGRLPLRLAMSVPEPVLLACSSYCPGGSSKKLNLPSLSEVADFESHGCPGSRVDNNPH